MDVSDSLGDASNVLLLGSSLNATTSQVARDLMTEADLAETSLLVVSYTRGPDTWLRRWREQIGDVPANARFISVTDANRSPSPETTDSVATAQTTPNGLTGVGIAVSNSLEAWRDSDTHVVAAFDSVTAMLQYSPQATAFRFLHTLTTRFRAVDARAHYHLDPAAHDDQTVARFTHLFDAVVKIDDERAVEVRA